MSTVQFTKNLTSENRKNGEWLLGYYWRNSLISKAPYYPITNWAGMLEFLDNNYPTYIHSLGEYLKNVPSDKMIQAMKDAAAKKYTDYPRPSYFENAIANYAGTFSFANNAGDIAADTASDVGTELVDITQGFFKTIAVVAAIAVGVVIYQKAGGKSIDFGKLKFWK
jgi:hypothetical protein